MPSIWIFGYGSLVHRPGFEHARRVQGYITGFKRVWHQGSTDHRGTPEQPGRVVTLEPDASALTWGVAYELPGDEQQQLETLRYLEWREKQYDVRHLVDVYGFDNQDVWATSTPPASTTPHTATSPAATPAPAPATDAAAAPASTAGPGRGSAPHTSQPLSQGAQSGTQSLVPSMSLPDMPAAAGTDGVGVGLLSGTAPGAGAVAQAASDPAAARLSQSISSPGLSCQADNPGSSSSSSKSAAVKQVVTTTTRATVSVGEGVAPAAPSAAAGQGPDLASSSAPQAAAAAAAAGPVAAQSTVVVSSSHTDVMMSSDEVLAYEPPSDWQQLSAQVFLPGEPTPASGNGHASRAGSVQQQQQGSGSGSSGSSSGKTHGAPQDGVVPGQLAGTRLLLRNVLCYIASSDTTRNVNWLGHAPMQDIAQQVAAAVGPSGANWEYVVRLANAMRQMNVEDAELFELEARVLQLRQQANMAAAAAVVSAAAGAATAAAAADGKAIRTPSAVSASITTTVTATEPTPAQASGAGVFIGEDEVVEEGEGVEIGASTGQVAGATAETVTVMLAGGTPARLK